MENKEVPFEYHNGELGVKTKFLISDQNKHENSICVISYSALARRLKSNTRSERELRRASLGFSALVVFASLPEEWRSELTFRFGQPQKEVQQSFFSKHYSNDRKAFDFYMAHRYGDDGNKKLTPELIELYTYNASVMNTILAVRASRKAYAKAIGVVGQFDIWASLSRDVNAFREVAHDLPTNKDALRRKVTKYSKEGYVSIISGKLTTRNAAKIKDESQEALIEELLSKHQNLNNKQIADLYNLVAKTCQWKTVDDSTIARKREELELFTKSYSRGTTDFMHTKLMQVKRSRPDAPLLFWVHDGWDAELLYQKTTIDSNGRSVTTYHNRPTVVMVLDPFNDYIVGYAIGERENASLIRQAYKNAINHTQELFSERHQPYQIQSDNYQLKHLQPFYESICQHFIPAKVKNSKAKVIEGFFNRFNTNHFQAKLVPNWSGHNVTAKSENQPNSDYLTKIRHQFPTWEGVVSQLVTAIENDRAEKREAFIKGIDNVDEKHLLPMSFEKYMHVFGETTGYTNQMEGDGLSVTIQGEKRWYDSFDINFRKYMHLDWMVRFDTDDLSQVLVTNAKSRNGRLVEEINSISFVLDEKYVQPMAIANQDKHDAQQRQLIYQYNEELTTVIVDRMVERKRTVADLFESNKELETLQKFMLPDSLGQHKDQKSSERIEKAQELLAKIESRDELREEKSWKQEETDYLKTKVDINNYLND